jgi:hypothetical protein
VIDLFNLKKVLKINRIHRGYKISLHDSIERYEKNEKNMDFIYIKNYHEKILPRYAEVHAIHSLAKKGFKPVKKEELSDRYVITLEKPNGTKFPSRVDRYKITVLPQENIILINGGNMPGDNCRQYARNYLKNIGKLESFTAYNLISIRDVIGKSQFYEKVSIGDKKKNTFLTNVCH